MRKLLKDTQTNLLAGLRLASFRSCKIDDFVINGDQLLVLLLLDLSLTVGLDFLLAMPSPLFDLYALPAYCFSQLVLYLPILIIARCWKKSWSFFMAAILAIISIAPLLNILNGWDEYLQRTISQPGSHYNIWGILIALYEIILLGRVFYIASGHLKTIAATTLVTIILISGAQEHVFGKTPKFWYPPEPEDSEEKDRWAEYRNMDAEKLMYRQPEILAAALKTLKPQRKHLSDLFFVGLAGYASEDVFSKEVTFAKNMLNKRFDTQGHSINLINHLATRDTVPLANGTNLAVTLKRIGSLMDKDEDVLMLYMTSHGSHDHRFAISFWPLAMNDITPDKLRAMLDEAGIKWRVIIVSACYSGGFIKALESDNTLIATAAAADKTSFGCGTESEFTYFGEAIFKDLLPHDYSIIAALQQAQINIGEREKREKITASSPQLSIGKAIKAKLDSLGGEIKLRECRVAEGKADC
ncbi:MAG: C13 family peptidase [Methylovulum sp.]|nr:C13 family peptidase [Methylovulum sp.]